MEKARGRREQERDQELEAEASQAGDRPRGGPRAPKRTHSQNG